MWPVSCGAVGPAQRAQRTPGVVGSRGYEETGVGECRAVLGHTRGHVEREEHLESHPRVFVLVTQRPYEHVKVRLERGKVST